MNSEISLFFWSVFREAASKVITGIMLSFPLRKAADYRLSQSLYRRGIGRTFDVFAGEDVFGEHHALSLLREVALKYLVVGHNRVHVFQSVSHR